MGQDANGHPVTRLASPHLLGWCIAFRVKAESPARELFGTSILAVVRGYSAAHRSKGGFQP